MSEQLCRNLWQKTPEPERTRLLEVLLRYIRALQQKHFRKNPANYLALECWKDEVVPTPFVNTDKRTVSKLSTEGLYDRPIG